MRLRPLLNLSRMHTAGWEILVFLLGPILIRESLISSSVVVLVPIAILVNSFIFVVNDLADLPRDRANPARANSPLVSGALAEPFALTLACSLPIAMWVLVALSDWPAPAQVSFGLLLLIGGILCVYQKTLPRVHPLVLDSLFGVTMAGPIPVTIASLGAPVPLFAWYLTGAFGVLCVGLNVIGGNLKDLDSDLVTGFRTTSLALGVRPGGESGTPVYTRRYRTFGYLMSTLVAVLVIASILGAPKSLWTVHGALPLVAVAVLSGGMFYSLLQLFRGRRPPSENGRDPFFAFGMAIVLVGASVSARPISLVLAVMAAVAWDLAFRWFWTWGATSEGAHDAQVPE